MATVKWSIPGAFVTLRAPRIATDGQLEPDDSGSPVFGGAVPPAKLCAPERFYVIGLGFLTAASPDRNIQ